MGERDNYIDVFFRNGLKEYEVLPPHEVWENISPVLRKREKSLNIYRIAAMVAILISLSAAAVWFTQQMTGVLNGPAILLNQDVIPAGFYKPENKNRLAAAYQPVGVNHDLQEPEFFNKSGNSAIENLLSVSSDNQNTGLILKSTDNTLRNSTPAKIYNLNSASSGSGKMRISAGTIQPESHINKWTISAMASPDYYSSQGTGNSQVANDLSKSEKSSVSYSCGMGFAYKVNKRISVQSGIIYSSIGQKVEGISSYSGFLDYNDSKGASQFSVQTSKGTIVTRNNNIFLMDEISGRVITKYTADAFNPDKANLTYMNSTVTQNFNYLEIPVLLRYKAIERKINVNLIGGLSYNMLVGNSAFAKIDGEKYSIGETEGLSPANFSSSLGLGFEYNLSRKMSLNVEPTFRYFITPMGGPPGSSVRPYSIGVFSGLSYKF